MSDGQMTLMDQSVEARCVVCGEAPRPCYQKEAVHYWECQGCGLLYQSPLPNPETMQEFAESEYTAGVYQEYVRARELKYATFRPRVRLLQQYVPHGRLLDVGCGSGYFLDVASQAGYDVYGIEFSAVAIKYASPQVQSRIVQGNIDQVQVDGLGQFDLITAFDVIEHSHAPLQFIACLQALLRPGGCLMVTTPDTRHVLRFLMGARWPMLQPLQHTFLFSRHSLRVALERVGFQVALLRRATKCLTIDYLASQIANYNPSLHRMYNTLAPFVPRAIRQLPVAINIGEMLVVAVKPI